MLKTICKNLWSRRSKNAWLTVELIVVTLLSWIIIDSAVVSLHDSNSDLGYDADRIINITMECIPRDAPTFDNSAYDPEVAKQQFETMLFKASTLPEVERMCHNYSGINGDMWMSTPMFTGDQAIDSIAPLVTKIGFLGDEKPLSVYGIEAAEGSPSVEELEARPLGPNDLIITESIDRYYWPDRRGIKDKYFIEPYSRDSTRLNVVGIVRDFRHKSFVRSGATFIQGKEHYKNEYYNKTTLILRLKPGIDADQYIRDNIAQITSQLRTGNYYVRSVQNQRQMIGEEEYSYGISSHRNLMILVAALFLINLIVGVTGCVWLQTGKRISEMGVLRSFGARKSQLMRLLIGESAVLATIACLIGIFIYFNYALSHGLACGFEDNSEYMPDNSWVNSFGAHFAIISAIVYAIILICTVIGTYFPARHVSRIEPVDALRDE